MAVAGSNGRTVRGKTRANPITALFLFRFGSEGNSDGKRKTVEMAKTRLIVRPVLFGLAVLLLLLQLLSGAYAVKDMWLVALARPDVGWDLLSAQLSVPGFWKVMLSSAECVALIVVLAGLFLRLGSAWKIYLVPAALTVAASGLTVSGLLPHVPAHLQSVLVRGVMMDLARGGLTLGLLYLLARLGRLQENRQEAAHV